MGRERGVVILEREREKLKKNQREKRVKFLREKLEKG